MSKTIVTFTCLSAVVFFIADMSATEPSGRPAKQRLVPRALPGEPAPTSGAGEHLVRKPPNGGASPSGVVLVQAEEKARIGVIRRGVGDEQPPGHARIDSFEIDAPKGERSGVPSTSALPPLRPGQIRVLPKSAIKADAGFEATAQQRP